MGFQKLKHGLFITRQNFPQFVETFNDLVDFCNSLRGDADAPNDSGIIRLDRRVRGRPVIRADTSKLLRKGGNVPIDVQKPFDIETETDESTGKEVMKVVRCFIPCPVAIVTAADYTIAGDDPIYLHIDRSSTSYAATVNQTSRANSATHAQFKLYELEDGTPTLDCRPTALPLLAF